MSQPSSHSKVEIAPIQLSLYKGEFAAPDNDQRSIGLAKDSAIDVGADFGTGVEKLKLTGIESSTPAADSLCPLASEFMRIFEAVSGWEVHFQETTASMSRRLASRDSNAAAVGQAPQGQFQIIDMSADWPAQTPTMHRGKCDQLIKLFSDLYSQANIAQENLVKVQDLLTALTDSTACDKHLVDSFAPMIDELVSSEHSDFVVNQDNNFDDDYESAFVVKQEFDSAWLPTKSVWSDWSIAGASGIVGETYLDWSQHGDVLTVYVGQIESSLGVGDTESSLEVNAISRQFKVSEDNTLAAFFFWDRRGGQLRSVEPGCWHTLYSQGAIVVSTDPDIQMPESIVNADLVAAPFTAEQLAAAIEAKIGSDHRVVVIQCD